MPSLSKAPALNEPIVPSLGESQFDLSRTGGTAYEQSIQLRSGPNFESQKANAYQSGSIQNKSQDIMPPSFASDVQIGV